MPATTARKALTLGGCRFTHPTTALIFRFEDKDDPLIFYVAGSLEIDLSASSLARSIGRFLFSIVRSEGRRKEVRESFGEILETSLDTPGLGRAFYVGPYVRDLVGM